MEFCEKCESIMFLKCEYETDPTDETVLGKSSLIYQCKICGNSKPTKKEDKCLYVNDYTGDVLSKKIVTNPFICLDPTLPIINNIKCPNKSCTVNKPSEYFANKIALNNVMYNYNNKLVNHCIDIMESKGLEKIDSDSEFTDLKQFKIEKFHTSIYIDLHPDNSDLNKYKKILIDDDLIKDLDIDVSKLNKLVNKITYIKYDNVNMKFMYICCYCNTCWKR